MKDIEINSDKFTVLAFCFFGILALLGLISDLYKLLTHRVAPHGDHGIVSYLVAGLTTYMAVTFCLDRQVRREYPFFVAGGCGIALGLLLPIAMRWVTAPPTTQHVADTFLTLLSIASFGLVLFEGIRWFKKRVRLSH
jgi:hypothetical protein